MISRLFAVVTWRASCLRYVLWETLVTYWEPKLMITCCKELRIISKIVLNMSVFEILLSWPTLNLILIVRL